MFRQPLQVLRELSNDWHAPVPWFSKYLWLLPVEVPVLVEGHWLTMAFKLYKVSCKCFFSFMENFTLDRCSSLTLETKLASICFLFRICTSYTIYDVLHLSLWSSQLFCSEVSLSWRNLSFNLARIVKKFELSFMKCKILGGYTVFP